MPTASEMARDLFANGRNCAQSVLCACCAPADRDMGMKVAQGFGGGLARSGRVCGAVTGALMAIGLKCGNADPKDDAARQKVQKASEAFLAEFERASGAVNCRDLIGCDLSTPEGHKKFMDEGLRARICVPLVERAAGIVERLAK
jgi:C_GCAxxG_C_C family probable redox protein